MNQILPGTLNEATDELKTVSYKRIATEEAFCPPEMFDIYREMLDKKLLDDPGFNTMFGFYLGSDSLRARQIREYLTDLGELRISHMDKRGIDMQVIAL